MALDLALGLDHWGGTIRPVLGPLGGLNSLSSWFRAIVGGPIGLGLEPLG